MSLIDEVESCELKCRTRIIFLKGKNTYFPAECFWSVRPIIF